MKVNEAKKNNVQSLNNNSQNNQNSNVFTKQSSKFIDLENKDANLLTNVSEANMNYDGMDLEREYKNKNTNDLTIINETSFINNNEDENDKKSTNRKRKNNVNIDALDYNENQELNQEIKKMETSKNVYRKSEINFDFRDDKKIESNKNLNVHFKKLTEKMYNNADKADKLDKSGKKKIHINKSKSMIYTNKDKEKIDESNLKSIKTFKVFQNDIFDDTNESKNMSIKESVKPIERRISKRLTYKGLK